jgi:hypothetical protein
MIQGFAASGGGFDTDPEGFFHPLLANVFVKGLRTKRAFAVLLFV